MAHHHHHHSVDDKKEPPHHHSVDDDSLSTARASAVSLASSPHSSSSSSSSSNKKSPTSPRNAGVAAPGKLGSHRRRLVLINPPSAFHPDIHPPSLVRVQRALHCHNRGTQSGLRDRLPPHIALRSRFRDEQGRFILEGSSGGHYVGDVVGGLPHGHGQHYIPLSSLKKMHLLYDGQWAYGSKTGKGIIFYTNGEEYRGELRSNQRWGCGWMRYQDGSFYVGDWSRGRRHGIGFHLYKNGDCFHGSFCKDSQDGWGTFYWHSIRRKFEGEWVVNQPYSGYYSHIDTEDFNLIQKRLLELCPQALSCLLHETVSQDRKMMHLQLQHPILTIFNVILELRAIRAGDNISKQLFKTQVGRKENLSATQLEILKNVIEVMVPMIDKKAEFPVTHLRRLLVLARIDPDLDQGEKLLAHLQECTKARINVGFDELLLYILQYHHP